MFPTIRNAVDAKIIYEIMAATKTGILGQLLVLGFTLLSFYDYIPSAYLIGWALLHLVNFSFRLIVVSRYHRAIDEEAGTKRLDGIFRWYLASLLGTSLLWAAMPLFIFYLPEEYHFLVYALVISLTYGSTMSIGPLTPIFLMYVLPMNLVTMGVLLYESGRVHVAAAFFLPVALFFAAKAAKMHLIDYTALIAQKTHVTELKDYFEYHASHDAMTGMPNRILFFDRLEKALQRAKAQGSALAILFLDLDRFKQINDTYGHAVGDQVLKIVSQRLRSALRSEDFPARFAGDEFVVIVEGAESRENLANIARHLHDAIASEMAVEELRLRVTPSIGIALFPECGEEMEDLIKSADEAMYRSKREGEPYAFGKPKARRGASLFS